jgi:predicted phage tail protein
MESFVKIKNVGRGEGIFRSVIGIILIVFSFFIPGGLRWVLGIIGVAFILTSIFGY